MNQFNNVLFNALNDFRANAIETLNDIKVLINDKTADRWINIDEVSRYISVSFSLLVKFII
ncbi:MAG: hypothetical protein CMG26_03840 [Candidatus Marinimicrobia bacterium]|nr:hypothetical protein [Candidatus Neomarinimicrobiota bacterium]|tara:strand:+ start:129 stop:311 length:183 start_codon:yes stop_codon:yes gene_type:complete